jgi:hypothetical protein
MKTKSLFIIVLTLLISLGSTGLALALIGDLDISGSVDDADMQVISAAFGSHSWEPVSANWDWRADLDKSGKVDLTDLVIAGRNYGDTFNFHWPRRVSNGRTADPKSTRVVDIDTDVDSRGNVHVIFHEYSTTADWMYYTQLDSAGNTLVEDLLLDKVARDGRVAVDADDNVHLVWTASGVLYTKLDSEGRTLVPTKAICASCLSPAIDTDSYGHPHILTRDGSGRLYYQILDDNGNTLLNKTRLNTQFNALGGGVQPDIAIGADDTRHILWYEDTPGVAGELVYTRISVGEIPDPNQLYFSHISAWNSHQLMIQVDSQGAAHVLWHDYRGTQDTVGSIFWQRVNADGSLSEEIQITNAGYHETPLEVRFSIDANDRIHYAARDEKINVGYGMLDRDGNILVSYQPVYYEDCSKPNLVATPDGQAVLVFGDYNGQVATNPMMVLSTVPDHNANDMSLPDLALDQAHADIQPWIARIIDNATLTVTVTNGGWVAADNVLVSFEEPIGQTSIPAETISSLPRFGSATIVRTFNLPDLEDVTALPIRISVSTTVTETTLNNNTITLTLGVIPPTRSVDLSVRTYDESYAPTDRDFAAALLGGQLTVEVPSLGYQDQVTATQAINGFIGVPLDPAGGKTMPTLIRLTLTGPGYTSETVEVNAARLADDPYRVSLDPLSPVSIYVNQWGTIQGHVYTGTTTTPLANATVYLDSSQSATTGVDGTFSFTKVVSGSHTLEAWHAGNAPTTKNVQVTTGDTSAPAVQMPPTTRGYLRGKVSNDLGRPFEGVEVKLKDGSTQITTATSDDQGRYSFEVEDASTYVSYIIEATCGLCDAYASAPFSLTAGLVEIHDFTLSWSITDANLQTSAEVTSWEQVERFNKLDEDEMSIGQLIKYKIKGLVNKFKSYEVDVWWAKYHYYLGLTYSETGGTKTVESLGIDLANYNLYSYDVQVGRYHGSVENIDLTALRVDRVDLVQVDAVGNVIGDVLWHDDTQWYASDPDSIPAWQVFNINESITDWSQAAVRVFIQVGKYTSDPDTSHWEVWHPPAGVGSLGGSGSAAGSDYQCLIWRLSSNEVEVLKSMAYYADVVGAANAIATPTEPTPLNEAAEATVNLVLPAGTQVQVGAPFYVEVQVSGAGDQPVFGLETDLEYNPKQLRFLRVEGAPDLAGTYGSWVVNPNLDATASTLSDAAVVTLGMSSGVTDGGLARIYFLPLAVMADTQLALSGVSLAGLSGETYSASNTTTLNFEIEEAHVFLPVLFR